MPYRPTRRSTVNSLCLIIVFAFVMMMSGCGKKGPLYMPTGNTTSQH